MNFARWIEDLRWAINVARARARRRGLTRDQRLVFDDELRPDVVDPLGYSTGASFPYPEAFYRVKADDFCRAAKESWAPSAWRVERARKTLRPEKP